MKWLLVILAIGLAASDKLDRTYLPPPGAQFAGGILGSHDAPFEPPRHTQSKPEQVHGGQGSQPNIGINGDPMNFGDKILKVPVTTTSYAFSQTTTYPPAEGFETTALPINPATGMPIQLEQGNFPYGTSQGQQNIHNLPSSTQSQAPIYNTNIQPGLVPQDPTLAPQNYNRPGYDQFANQPVGQYSAQNVNPSEGAPQTPESVFPGQNQGQQQFFDRPGNLEQQGFFPTGSPNNQRFDKYHGQKMVNPGGVIEIPGGKQDFIEYPGSQTITGQQEFVPSTGSPINLQPGGKQYGVNYDRSQSNYNGQPINLPNLDNQEAINIGGIPSQYPNGNQNYGPSVPTGSDNTYQTPSTLPSSYNNGVSNTTPLPGVPSLTSAYSSVRPVYRPKRPQAAADRNAVILNYENVRTPNGYSYSFDTSNGIHADESGIVDNGTKAQGAYSYIGDDGKVYSVIYTADENGFQPRGDHLPTPPPIPEAIQRVIEQAARDKAAGIIDDGSYDEAKYGDQKHHGTETRHRPQNQNKNRFSNRQFNGARNDQTKPVAEIKDGEYNKDIGQLNQLNKNQPVTGTSKSSNNVENNVQKGYEGNRKVTEKLPIKDYNGNVLPMEGAGINEPNNYGPTKLGTSGSRPVSNGVDLPFTETINTNENTLPGSENRRLSERRPVSGRVKDVTEKYPGSNVDVGAVDYSDGGRDGFNNGEGQDNLSDSPSISGKNINTNFDSATGALLPGNTKQAFGQKIKGNRRPSPGMRNSQNNAKPQVTTPTQESTQQVNPHDGNGYHYQQPNTKYEQNKFPTRFSTQKVSPTRNPDQRRTEYVEGTTRKPFMTPNVYYQNNKNSQSTPNTYDQKNKNSQSTTRRPFTTVGVTSPSDNSYNDYDDDYATDQNIGDDRNDSKIYPDEKSSITARPYQSTQTTLRPNNAPGGQRTRINEKGILTPERKTGNPGTLTPGYTYGPTTQMPSHTSRFGSNEFPRRMKPQQRRPSTTVSDSTTAVSRPITTQSTSVTEQSDYKYQPMVPNSKYSGSNVGSGYPTGYPGLTSMSATPAVSAPQDFYTSTYGPSQVYSSTTTVPPTSGYTQGSSSQVPTGTPGSFQTSQDDSFHTGYHYGPPKSGSFNPEGPGFFAPTSNSGIFPTSPTGTSQTIYQQGPGGFPSTTLIPITPGKQGSLMSSQPGSLIPEISPINYQGNYQNGPSTPDYATTIVSSTPGAEPVFGYSGLPGGQETTGYKYGPSVPTYSTTNSPSTIGTTPGPFIPTGTTGSSRGYTTTYRPGFQNTEDSFLGGPVDGFGRPITTEHGGSHPGYGHPTQGTTSPVNNIGPNIGGADQFTVYPGSNDKNRIIGEDFSGPKQPQRFDPKTGYHYK